MLHFPFWLLLLLFISVETKLTINDNEGLIDTLLTAMRLYIEDATKKQSLSKECRDVIDTSFLEKKYLLHPYMVSVCIENTASLTLRIIQRFFFLLLIMLENQLQL